MTRGEGILGCRRWIDGRTAGLFVLQVAVYDPIYFSVVSLNTVADAIVKKVVLEW